MSAVVHSYRGTCVCKRAIEAKLKLEAATKAANSMPSVLIPMLVTILCLLGTLGCGAIVLLAYANKADPGILLPFFLVGLVFTAAIFGLFFMRNRKVVRLNKNRDVASNDLAAAEQSRQALIQERDRKRAAAGL